MILLVACVIFVLAVFALALCSSRRARKRADARAHRWHSERRLRSF